MKGQGSYDNFFGLFYFTAFEVFDLLTNFAKNIRLNQRHMNNAIKIKDNIYWIGVNDRRTHIFENYWPLPKGVAYNRM